DHALHLLVADDALDLHLGQEADLVFHPPVALHVAALLPAPADLRHRDPDDAELLQRRVYVLEPVRPQDALNLCHARPPSWRNTNLTQKKLPVDVRDRQA